MHSVAELLPLLHRLDRLRLIRRVLFLLLFVAFNRVWAGSAGGLAICCHPVVEISSFIKRSSKSNDPYWDDCCRIQPIGSK